MSMLPTRGWFGWLLLVLLWGLLAWRLVVVPQQPRPMPAVSGTEDQRLFEHALEQGLISSNENGEISTLPPDQLLAARQRGEAVSPATERLFSALQSSPAGVAVRAEIKRWNRSRAIAAVRDNSLALSGVSQQGWQVRGCKGERRELGGGVPETYGFLLQGLLQAGFSPWQVVGGRGCTHFSNRFVAQQPQDLTLWLIGQPKKPRSVTTVLPLQQPPPAACTPADAADSDYLHAAQRLLSADDWRPITGPDDSELWEYQVDIRLDAVPYRAPRVDGLSIAIDRNDCRLRWLPGERATHAERGTSRVYSSDGELLLERNGQPTKLARNIGLLPLVGLSPQDQRSLSGLLSRSAIPASGLDVRLTIDSRLQGIAQALLSEGVADHFPADSDRYALDRRASLLVLNGRTGAILAAAGLPQIAHPERYQQWDLDAFARDWPATDPLRVAAWEGPPDADDTPGAALIPLTALAALSKAGDDNEVADLIAGLDAANFVERTGLALDTDTYDPYGTLTEGPQQPRYLLRNVRLTDGRRQSFATELENPDLSSPDCGDERSTDNSLGLASATRDSLSIWFAHLALLVDGAEMDELDLNIRSVPAPRLLQSLHTLGLDKPLNLLTDSPAFLDHQHRPVLPAAQFSLLGVQPQPARWTLARNAIGEGVSTTPLHIARLAAAVASGSVVQPHLVAAWNGVPVRLPASAGLPAGIAPLRMGMRATPQVGSAASAFANEFDHQPDSPLRCNSYGITATAAVGAADINGEPSYNSVWFMGWYQPDDGDPMVFTCMVSHAHGVGSSTGGQVCAPIVAGFLATAFPEVLPHSIEPPASAEAALELDTKPTTPEAGSNTETAGEPAQQPGPERPATPPLVPPPVPSEQPTKGEGGGGTPAAPMDEQAPPAATPPKAKTAPTIAAEQPATTQEPVTEAEIENGQRDAEAAAGTTADSPGNEVNTGAAPEFEADIIAVPVEAPVDPSASQQRGIEAPAQPEAAPRPQPAAPAASSAADEATMTETASSTESPPPPATAPPAPQELR